MNNCRSHVAVAYGTLLLGTHGHEWGGVFCGMDIAASIQTEACGL
jgi:hypothetical protein